MRSMMVPCLLIAVMAGGAAAQTAPVGRIEAVVVYAYATKQGDRRQAAYAADRVHANQKLETVAGGALAVRFADGTELALGGGSDIVIDATVFDPRQPAMGQLAVTFNRGAFRFVSGSVPKERIAIRTPNAVIGIRGTDWTMVSSPDGGTVLNLREGAARVVALADNSVAEVAARQSVVIAAGGGVGPVSAFPPQFAGQTGDDRLDRALFSNQGVPPPQTGGVGGSAGGSQ